MVVAVVMVYLVTSAQEGATGLESDGMWDEKPS